MPKGRILKLYETRAVFENLGTGSCLVASQLKDGIRDMTTCDTTQLPDIGAPIQVIPLEAIYGIYDLLSGPFVALVLESEPFVSREPCIIRKMKKVLIVPLFRNTRQLSSKKQTDEDRYLFLLHSAFAEHQFFFSPTYDLTQTQQRISKFTSKNLSEPLWAR